jgi:hypothetical protein
LVLGFLKQEGLMQAAEVLAEEAALTAEFEVCDNIDLDIILQVSITFSSYLLEKRLFVTLKKEIK